MTTKRSRPAPPEEPIKMAMLLKSLVRPAAWYEDFGDWRDLSSSVLRRYIEAEEPVRHPRNTERKTEHWGILDDLIDTRPELRKLHNAREMWQEAAKVLEELRGFLAICPPTPEPPGHPRPTLRKVLHEIAATLAAAAPQATSEFARGRRAGLDAARVRLLQRAELAREDGDDHRDKTLTQSLGFPPIPTHYWGRPRPREDNDDLPRDAERRERLVSVLRRRLPDVSADVCARIAQQLLRKLPPVREIIQARTQWDRHEAAIEYLVDSVGARLGFTLVEAHSRAFIAWAMKAQANKLMPGLAGSGASFATGYDAAHLLAASQLRTRPNKSDRRSAQAHRGQMGVTVDPALVTNALTFGEIVLPGGAIVLAAEHDRGLDESYTLAEREQVAARVRDAAAAGMLTLAETDERQAAAYAARICADLAELTDDLPAAQTRGPAEPDLSVPLEPRVRRRLAAHLAVAVVLAAVLIVRWALGPVPWFWPAGPMFWLALSVVVHYRWVRHRRAGQPQRVGTAAA